MMLMARERERERTLIYFLEENTMKGGVAVSPQFAIVVGERARKMVESKRVYFERVGLVSVHGHSVLSFRVGMVI